jgi:hypothetical protein
MIFLLRNFFFFAIKVVLCTGRIIWVPWLTAGDVFWHKSSKNVKNSAAGEIFENFTNKDTRKLFWCRQDFMQRKRKNIKNRLKFKLNFRVDVDRCDIWGWKVVFQKKIFIEWIHPCTFLTWNMKSIVFTCIFHVSWLRVEP